MKPQIRALAGLAIAALLGAGAGAQGVQPPPPSRAGLESRPAFTRPSAPDTGEAVDGILTEVLANNPSLRAARERERSAAARIPAAGAWDDPQAGIEFYATPITSANPFVDGMETDYFLQQMIPFPGKKGAMVEAAEAGARMAGQSAAAVERSLAAQTKRAVAMLYAAQRRLEVNAENQRLLEQIIVSARAKYSVGAAAEADVLKVQVELAQLQNERAALDQEVSSAAAMLNALRNRPGGTAIGRIAEPPPQPVALPLDSLTRLALEARPELRGMQYEIQMNRADLSASRKEWLPDLMLKGTYKQMTDQTDQWAAMIGINIPIAPWGIGKYTGKNEENEARLRGSEESLLDMQNMVQSGVRDAYARVQARWQQTERYRTRILPQAEQSLNANLASYRTDRVDFLSLLDSYRMFQMFQMEYYMAVGEYFSDLASLELAVGRDLR